MCKLEFAVGMLMKHYKSCSDSRKYTGNIPELFEDLKHLLNPTDKFISLYNKSVNEMWILFRFRQKFYKNKKCFSCLKRK